MIHLMMKCVSDVTEYDKMAAIQTRAMADKEQKPLKVTSIKGLDIRPEQKM